MVEFDWQNPISHGVYHGGILFHFFLKHMETCDCIVVSRVEGLEPICFGHSPSEAMDEWADQGINIGTDR